MDKTQTKVLAKNLIGLGIGLFINLAVDRKLEKAENPGKVNKFVRRQLAWGRKYGFLINIAQTVALVALAREQKPST